VTRPKPSSLEKKLAEERERLDRELNQLEQEIKESNDAKIRCFEAIRGVVRFIMVAHDLAPDVAGTVARGLIRVLRPLSAPRPPRAERYYELMKRISNTEKLHLWSDKCAERAGRALGKSTATMVTARRDGSALKRRRYEQWKVWRRSRKQGGGDTNSGKCGDGRESRGDNFSKSPLKLILLTCDLPDVGVHAPGQGSGGFK
jgi:hypothetical protein